MASPSRIVIPPHSAHATGHSSPVDLAQQNPGSAHPQHTILQMDARVCDSAPPYNVTSMPLASGVPFPVMPTDQRHGPHDCVVDLSGVDLSFLPPPKAPPTVLAQAAQLAQGAADTLKDAAHAIDAHTKDLAASLSAKTGVSQAWAEWLLTSVPKSVAIHIATCPLIAAAVAATGLGSIGYVLVSLTINASAHQSVNSLGHAFDRIYRVRHDVAAIDALRSGLSSVVSDFFAAAGPSSVVSASSLPGGSIDAYINGIMTQLAAAADQTARDSIISNMGQTLQDVCPNIRGVIQQCLAADTTARHSLMAFLGSDPFATTTTTVATTVTTTAATTTTTTAAATTASVAPTALAQTAESQLSSGAIAGISIGAFIVFAALAYGGYRAVKRWC